ncbi:PH domain-containing protein [Candidatus Woesearchaeota archaeon]|nr:hypothetical protein [uncultured archaeon]AQS33873.1 hypothetical protein [uncultured archaeon]MBS3124903.1 PH domain-containing protein [Candidatus Woesearchaeota archaeon]
MKFHISRWHFWWGYTVLFVLLVAGMWFNDRAQDLQARVFFVLSVILFVILEVVVHGEQVSLEKSRVVIAKGYPRKRTAVDYQSIAGVQIEQCGLQKLFGCGTLTIKNKEGGTLSVKHIEHVTKLHKVLS